MTDRRDGEASRAGWGASESSFVQETLVAVRRVELRLRAERALVALTRFLPPVALVASLGVLGAVAWRVELPLPGVLAVVLVGVAVAAVLVFLRGPGRAEAARVLDRAQGRSDEASFVLELSERRARGEPLDPYWALALRRARSLVPKWDVGAAQPWRLPQGTFRAAALLAIFGVSCFLRLEESVVAAEPPPVSQSEAPPLFGADERELAELRQSELERQLSSKAGERLAGELSELVGRLSAPGLDAEEALRRLDELERATAEEAARREALAQGLEERGRALAERGPSRELGQALRSGRAEDVAQALERLAERLKDPKSRLTPQELTQLRKELEKARPPVTETSAKAASEEAAEAERLEEKKKRLLQKKQNGELTPAERQELERTERRLEKLDRRKKESVERELDELDRQIAEAARELESERQKSGEFLEQAAQKLRQAEQKTLDEKEKKALLERLRQLKEALRRQRESGAGAEAKERFERRARGRPGGEGQEGQNQGQGQESPGSVSIPVPSRATGPGSTPGEGQEGAGETPGSQPGKEPGSAHDPQVAGSEATKPLGARPEDVAAVAQDSGAGESASETIRAAAEEGFTRRSYGALYREYQTALEEVLVREKIPAGHRSQIERYFELIRPRGARKEE